MSRMFDIISVSVEQTSLVLFMTANSDESKDHTELVTNCLCQSMNLFSCLNEFIQAAKVGLVQYANRYNKEKMCKNSLHLVLPRKPRNSRNIYTRCF